MQSELALLKERINKLEGYPLLEKTYQKFLENVYKASHVKCKFGESDIETDTEVIEIKNFNQYKSALGQILAYSHGKNKIRIIYFFGDKPKNISDICLLFQEYNINVYHIWQDNLGDFDFHLISESKVKANEHDMNASFVTKCLKKGGDGVKWTELFAAYQAWYHEETGEQLKIKKQTVKVYFESKVFKTKENPVRKLGGRGWSGWTLTTTDLDLTP